MYVSINNRLKFIIHLQGGQKYIRGRIKKNLILNKRNLKLGCLMRSNPPPLINY